MIFRKTLTSLAIGGYILAGTVANAAPAASAARVAAPVEDAEGIGGMSGTLGWVIALAVAVGVVLIIASDDNNDEPFSP